MNGSSIRLPRELRDRGRVRRMRVDDRADVGPPLVDDEVQPDLAEHLAAADHRALVIDLDQIGVGDQPLRGRGRRGDETPCRDGRIARAHVAVVVGDPAGGVQVLRGLRDLHAQLLHESTSTASTMPTIALRIGT